MGRGNKRINMNNTTRQELEKKIEQQEILSLFFDKIGSDQAAVMLSSLLEEVTAHTQRVDAIMNQWANVYTNIRDDYINKKEGAGS